MQLFVLSLLSAVNSWHCRS